MEKQLAEVAVRRLAAQANILIEVEGPNLVVYLDDRDSDAWRARMARILPREPAVAKALHEINSHDRLYQMMSFVLRDEQRRLFWVERWCFLGRIDGWILLSAATPLAEVLEKYAPHLGRESFFQLMYGD